MRFRKSFFLFGAFFLFLFALPLGMRYLIHQFTTGFHEYETAFLYLSDGALIFFLILAWRWGKSFSVRSKILLPFSLVFLGLSTLFSLWFSPSLGLALYVSFRLMLCVLLLFAVSFVVSTKNIFRGVCIALGLFAVLQSSIAIGQFALQGNVGLRMLGESPIHVLDGGTSKILIDGVRVVRGYGTFPHPNVLAAFLLLGFAALSYLSFFYAQELYRGFRYKKEMPVSKNFLIFFKRKLFFKGLLASLGLFMITSGLVVCFSRAGWGIAILIALGFLCFAGRGNYRLKFRFLGLILAIGFLAFMVFGWAILPRATVSPSEQAVSLRVSYNTLGAYLIAFRPFGVGIGNQVLYSVWERVYQEFGMYQAWQWQPIHNIYLLIASEIGILGLLGFLGLILGIVWQNMRNGIHLERLAAIFMLFGLLAFGLTDHFLWTLEQGRLMLWLVAGLVLATQRKQFN